MCSLSVPHSQIGADSQVLKTTRRGKISKNCGCGLAYDVEAAADMSNCESKCIDHFLHCQRGSVCTSSISRDRQTPHPSLPTSSTISTTGRTFRLPFIWMADDLMVLFFKVDRPFETDSCRVLRALLDRGFCEALLAVGARVCLHIVKGRQHVPHG